MQLCNLGTASFQNQIKGKEIDTKFQIRNKVRKIEDFTNYMKQFANSFTYYLIENKPLLQHFMKIPLVNNFGGQGKQTHAMIILYKTLFTTLNNTKSQLLTKTQDFKISMKLQISQFYDETFKSYEQYDNNNGKRTNSRQFLKMNQTETGNQNHYLTPLRKMMSLCSQEKQYKQQFKKRRSFQYSQKSNYNSAIKQFENNTFFSQKNNRIQPVIEDSKLSEHLLKQTNQYCNSIILTLSYLFAETNQQTNNLLFILEKSLDLLSNQYKLFEQSQSNFNLDQIHKKLSNKLFIESQIWMISRKIIEYQQLTTDKLISLRISCKIIIDALSNIVISFQRFINYSKNLSQNFKIENSITEDTNKTIQIINKINNLGAEFVQKSLVQTNSIVEVFHNINNITQDVLSNLTSASDISLFNNQYLRSTKQQVEMATKVFLNKIEYLKCLPNSKIQSISKLHTKFTGHFKNTIKCLNQFTQSANNTVKSFHQISSPIKHKDSDNILTNSNSQQLQQEQKTSLNVSIDKIIVSSSKMLERSNAVIKLIQPVRGEVLRKQVFQKTSLIHLINLLFKNKLCISQEQFSCFYQFYQRESGDEKTIISKWNQNMEYFVTENSLQENTPLLFKRTISFDHPIGGFKLPFLPRCCKSVQNQTLYIVDNSRAILDVQVNSRQAPYTDCFQVIMRFQFKESNGNVDLNINTYVNWVKSTLMKSIIQPQTMKQITQSVILFCELINKVLKFQPYKPIRKQKKNNEIKVIQSPAFKKNVQQQIILKEQSTIEIIKQCNLEQQNYKIQVKQNQLGLQNYLFILPVLIIFVGFTSILNNFY